jgi:hypothetical protein
MVWRIFDCISLGSYTILNTIHLIKQYYLNPKSHNRGICLSDVYQIVEDVLGTLGRKLITSTRADLLKLFMNCHGAELHKACVCNESALRALVRFGTFSSSGWLCKFQTSCWCRGKEVRTNMQG